MFSLQTIFGKGDRFFALLEDSAAAALDGTRALLALVERKSNQPSLEEFRLARERERKVADAIRSELVHSFITVLEREDIEALGNALYRIPKTVEKFAERYALAGERIHVIDFVPRARMLVDAAEVVVKMVHELKGMQLEPMKALSDRLRAIEVEADRLMLELYRELYAGKYDPIQTFMVHDFYEILEKAIDRCREAGVVTYQIVLKNN
ncbi:MAG TPA: pit accessory protein [Xanthomonadales bacterium]|nr:pit accessory protein [Xanthomonadales bacterium]